MLVPLSGMDLLQTITKLSREFGTDDFVKGGGGNASAKDADTLWIKPSGTTMSAATPESFVLLDRGKLTALYDANVPLDPTQREAAVKDLMLQAVRPGATGRPSVESPMHDSFDATYVIHTHPELVDGMTCANDGESAAASMFPDALWLHYTDPGYTLSMQLREKLAEWRAERGDEPTVVFLQNHGLLIAGNSERDVTATFESVLDPLRTHYANSGIPSDLARQPDSDPDAVAETEKQIRAALGTVDAAEVLYGGRFAIADGPISPDHIVYEKPFPFIGEPTRENVEAFRDREGYSPRVISCEVGVFGVGTNQKNAELAIALAVDGAVIKQLAEAFGGIKYLDKAATDFIDNWEIEASRRKLAEE